MKNLFSIGTLGIAGLVSAGLLAFPTTTIAADSGEAAFTKRDDDVTELVLVDDDDDNDSNDNSRSRNSRSRNSNDHTRSNFTAVSRDRDLSRGDKTRDWTRDGKGDRTRDWSQNKTNDRSRNDTR